LQLSPAEASRRITQLRQRLVVPVLEESVAALDRAEVPSADDGTARKLKKALMRAYSHLAKNPEVLDDPKAEPHPGLIQADVLARELLLSLPACGIGYREL